LVAPMISVFTLVNIFNFH